MGSKRKRTEPFSNAEVRAWVRRTRLAQGLPATLVDERVIAKLVHMLTVFREYPTRDDRNPK